MFLTTMFAAALLGSGVANAAGTLYPKDYMGGAITLGSKKAYDTLIVDVPLTLTGFNGFLDLYDGATIEFQKDQATEEICSISTAVERTAATVFFGNTGDVYNFTFDDGAQAVVAASAGTPITLISDLNEANKGFRFFGDISPSDTVLKLNGAVAGGTVVLDGVSFTYVGPKESDYVFQTGEIGFTGYYDGSHALKLAHGGGLPTPEPTTGSLSLLALAGLCARRRRK